MSRNIVSEKRLIALSTEAAAQKVAGISLMPKNLVGDSYPYRPDALGVWVYGPDQSGLYTISVNISVTGLSIPDATNQLRSAISAELQSKDLANLVKAVDINVEGWAKEA